MTKIIIIALLVIIVIVAWYFLIYKPAQTIVDPNQGKPCTIGGVPGKIENGICVPIKIGSGSVSLK